MSATKIDSVGLQARTVTATTGDVVDAVTTVHAGIVASCEWARGYFGSVHVNPILDRPSPASLREEDR